MYVIHVNVYVYMQMFVWSRWVKPLDFLAFQPKKKCSLRKMIFWTWKNMIILATLWLFHRAMENGQKINEFWFTFERWIYFPVRDMCLLLGKRPHSGKQIKFFIGHFSLSLGKRSKPPGMGEIPQIIRVFFGCCPCRKPSSYCGIPAFLDSPK